MEHKKGVIFSIIGGLLMIMGSVVWGLGFIGRILTFAVSVIEPETGQILALIISILGYIAAGGGVSVIVGALIAGYSSNRLGRILIGFGGGISLFGLIIILITNIISGASTCDIVTILLGTFNGIYGLSGIIITIISCA